MSRTTLENSRGVWSGRINPNYDSDAHNVEDRRMGNWKSDINPNDPNPASREHLRTKKRFDAVQEAYQDDYSGENFEDSDRSYLNWVKGMSRKISEQSSITDHIRRQQEKFDEHQEKAMREAKKKAQQRKVRQLTSRKQIAKIGGTIGGIDTGPVTKVFSSVKQKAMTEADQLKQDILSEKKKIKNRSR
jgi:hypothetical protein